MLIEFRPDCQLRADLKPRLDQFVLSSANFETMLQ